MSIAIDYNKYFENYNFINDFCFNKNDYISEMLLKSYQTSVYNVDVNNKEELKKIKKIDKIMKFYIIDKEFFQIVQKKLTDLDNSFTQDLNEILIEEYTEFENNVVPFTTSRWI